MGKVRGYVPSHPSVSLGSPNFLSRLPGSALPSRIESLGIRPWSGGVDRIGSDLA